MLELLRLHLLYLRLHLLYLRLHLLCLRLHLRLHLHLLLLTPALLEKIIILKPDAV